MQRLDSVSRAGRVEPATRADQRSQQPLIQPNQQDQYAAHASTSLIWGTPSANAQKVRNGQREGLPASNNDAGAPRNRLGSPLASPDETIRE
jgi:hypothetical protein